MYHHRRKSGHGSANTSMTDVRKAVSASDPSKYKRPAGMTRRSTPQSTYKLGKSPKERERDFQHDWDDDERDTFPQYCMTCEKEFLPLDERCVYCSEACRKYDQNPANHRSTSKGSNGNSGTAGHYPFYATGDPEPRDIIPRASPSRPSSTYFSSPPVSPNDVNAYQQTTAISALRSLSIQQSSPPSPTVLSSGIWPFKTSAASPSTSYSREQYSSTYDAAYSNAGYGHGHGHGHGHGYGYGYNYSSSGMDRPLPSRRPGGYSRPKSIELVTPMVGR